MQLVKKTMMMAGALLLALNVCGQENVPAEKKGGTLVIGKLEEI